MWQSMQCWQGIASVVESLSHGDKGLAFSITINEHICLITSHSNFLEVDSSLNVNGIFEAWSHICWVGIQSCLDCPELAGASFIHNNARYTYIQP